MFLTIRRDDNKPTTASFTQAQNDTHLQLYSNKLQVQLAKRTSFPATYCHPIGGGSFQLGYGNTAPKGNEEFLKINIQANGTIDIQRDTRATLPIFYGYAKGTFVLSNDYGTVVEALPHLTLNVDDIILSLAPRRFYHPTLWNEIGVLRSGETLHAGVGETPVKSMLYTRTWEGAHDVPPSDPEEFLPRLDDLLARHLQTYAPLPEHTPPAFEVSGGLDSPTALLYFAQAYPDTKWHGMSIVYPDVQKVTQTNKLYAILEQAPNGTLDFCKMSQMLDGAAARLTSFNTRPVSPRESLSNTTLDSMANNFEKVGARVVFNGVGGDELFDHNITAKAQLDIGEEPMQHLLKQLPDFLTDHFHGRLRTLNKNTEKKYILPALSTGASGSDPVVNIYINHGIWPVSPFLDSEFYTYCQGLPYKFKHNKHILRAYYRAKKWPEVLYGEMYTNETPKDELEKPFLTDEFAQIIEEFAHTSIIGHLGYIDIPNLLQTYRDIRKGTRSIEPGIFCISLWLNLEFNLRLAINSGQWKPE